MTEPIQVPVGMVCVTTYGSITAETASALMEMRSQMEAQGLKCPWPFIPGSLVDRARNQAVVQMLNMQPQMGWLLFIDGDAQFPIDGVAKLLVTAYQTHPQADVVGAYCTLRGEPYLPTIDTGTGTWESYFPGQGPNGVVEVMRTGSAFILLKRHVFERIQGPWYGTRHPWRPIDALAEVDNFAHTRFDGRNPLAEMPEWKALLQCAKDDPSTRTRQDPSAFVGEDSNWCDTMRFHGLRIFVNTNVEARHIDRAVRSAANHGDAMKEREKLIRNFVGVVK